MAEQCPVPAFTYQPGSAILSDPDAPVVAEADHVVSEDGTVSLDGNTTISFQGRELSAENAQYKPDTGEVIIDGQLTFRAEGISLDSENARFDMDDDLFSTGMSRYELNINGKRATGDADHMERDAEGNFKLDGATYSTCPPGDKSWFIRASRIQLFPGDGIGTARSISLNFKGVPLLYIPAFSFPISPARKTGMLAPIFALGENTGFELHLPWYWNIRPNLDATFTPRLMSKRGAQLQSELRYLNEQGEWTLDNEYLRDTEKDGDTRHFTQLRHQGRFGTAWSSSINASLVSDKDYFQDLGNSLQLASITHLERRADLRFSNGPVNLLARLQSFQTVDDDILASERPYKRLPQFTLQATAPGDVLGIRTEVEGELVYFDRNDSVTGSRFDLQPRLSLPISRDAWFIAPSVSHRFTYYSLNNREPEQSAHSSRNLNTFAVDGGLYFDRPLNEKGSVQTLEPRLLYLRVPFQDQSNLPIFDSSEFDFNISQLFRENRFTGADRVADANQLSLALTSRFINARDGREVLRGSIGQITYFDDRRVTLDGDGVETRDTSDLVGELSAELDENWLAKGSIQWNPDDEQTVRGSVLLSYRPGNDRIVNFGHRTVNFATPAAGTESREDTEQLDFSVLWPVSDSWRIAGRWNYSLEQNVSIESLLGIEYDSCCWALRFAARRYIADNDSSDEVFNHDTSFYLQLVLKGLAPVGQNYGALLENAILGYRDEYR
jgi:LPS-assembly protein